MGRSSFLIDTDYAEAFCEILQGMYGVKNQKSRHVENELGRYMIDGTPVIVRSNGAYSSVIGGRLTDTLDNIYGQFLKEIRNGMEASEESDGENSEV